MSPIDAQDVTTNINDNSISNNMSSLLYVILLSGLLQIPLIHFQYCSFNQGL